MQPKKKKCERCSLYYTEALPKCSHCGHLDDAGLSKLKEKQDDFYEANASLAKYFLFVALIIFIGLIAVTL